MYHAMFRLHTSIALMSAAAIFLHRATGLHHLKIIRPARCCRRRQPRPHDGRINAAAIMKRSSTSLVAMSASTSSSSSRTDMARQLVHDGMRAFRNYNVTQSIVLFDAANDLSQGALSPYLWQRGLSLYYADRFAEACDQFERDVLVNPNDTEEVVWHTASLLRLRPVPFPPPQALVLPANARDSRPIMARFNASVYRLFRGRGREQELAIAGHVQQSPSDDFYAALYLALYCECRRQPTKASSYLRVALQTTYASTSTDYMVAVARVHARLRGWE